MANLQRSAHDRLSDTHRPLASFAAAISSVDWSTSPNPQHDTQRLLAPHWAEPTVKVDPDQGELLLFSKRFMSWLVRALSRTSSADRRGHSRQADSAKRAQPPQPARAGGDRGPHCRQPLRSARGVSGTAIAWRS